MSALTVLAPAAVRFAAGTNLSQSQYFGLALLGADLLTSRLFKVVQLLDKIASRADADAAAEMVSRMRADVPRDTGNLFNGIGYRQEGDVVAVWASAVHRDKNGGEDYAAFVERGTAPGHRGRSHSYMADANYHDMSADIGDGSVRAVPRRYGRTRLQYRSHPGTPAQPFFFENVFDVLRERRGNLRDIIDDETAGDFA